MNFFARDAAGRVASRLVHHDGTPDEGGELFGMSVRVSAELKATIDSMASDAGVSRNTLMIDLLYAGITAVVSELPPEVRPEYEDLLYLHKEAR